MTKWSSGISSCLLHGLLSPRNGNLKTFNVQKKDVKVPQHTVPYFSMFSTSDFKETQSHLQFLVGRSG